ncbi:hypothetical protein [Caldisericum exile]|uniref:hypothetical protein n=1 Tax=Caldisericum exile TaxID=693075 RepID=UPI003C77CC03
MEEGFYEKRIIKRIIVFALFNIFLSQFIFITGDIVLSNGYLNFSQINSYFVQYQKTPSEFSYGYVPIPFDASHLQGIAHNNYVVNEFLPTSFD